MIFVNNLRLLFISLLFCLSQLCYAQIVTIDNLTRNILVKNNVSYLEDTNNNLNFENIQGSGKFTQIKTDIPNFGVSSHAFWLKLTILNKTQNSNFVMQVSQPGLDEVDFYHPEKDGKYIYTHQGEDLTFDKREFFDPNYIFRFELPPGKITDVFFKIKAKDNIQAPLKIGTVETISESNKIKDTLAGIYLGIMFVMFFYNAFLFLTVKDKVFLYYIIYLAAVILAQVSVHGYTFQYLYPQIPILATYSSFIFPPLAGITSIYFMRNFLHARSFYPLLDKLLNVFVVGYIAAFIISVTGNFKLSFILIQMCASMVSMYMLAVAYLIHKKGFRPARFFLIAWVFFLLGVTIYVLKDVGVLPYNNLTLYTMTVGSAIEVVLLSFALADRINILKKEKEESQAEVLRALQLNEKLITEQNVILEQKVTERTEELETKNVELGETLKNLKETQAQLVDAEKMASLGQLTAGIAHEINNPINFVSANIKPLQMDIADVMEVIKKYEGISHEIDYRQQLKEIDSFKKEIDLDYVKEEIDTLLGGIEDGAKRTAEIVKGLKNFSRLDESDIKEANLNEGIESTLVLLKNSITNDIEIIKNLGTIPFIECFPGKLNQVFMNVMNNSIQAIHQKKIKEKNKLIISSYLNGDSVCVSIEDTGVGMTPEVKSKVFEPFFTTKEVGEGTGLGMSIVFKIIESHHGKIDIESELGIGTKVLVTLPLKIDLSA